MLSKNVKIAAVLRISKEKLDVKKLFLREFYSCVYCNFLKIQKILDKESLSIKSNMKPCIILQQILQFNFKTSFHGGNINTSNKV